MRIFDQLKNTDGYTIAEKEIAQYINAHPQEVVSLSLDELSQKLFVSKSTVIRFCKKLGFKGHKDFTVEMARELKNFIYQEELIDPQIPFKYTDSREAMAKKTYNLMQGALDTTFQDLKLAELMSIARSIHDNASVIYTSDDMLLTALNFAGKLNQLEIKTETVRPPESLLHRAQRQMPSSVSLFITYEGNETELLKCAKVLKDKQIPVLLITGPTKNAMARIADECISTAYYEPKPSQMSFASELSIVLVMNILSVFIYNMDYKKNNQKLGLS